MSLLWYKNDTLLVEAILQMLHAYSSYPRLEAWGVVYSAIAGIAASRSSYSDTSHKVQ